MKQGHQKNQRPLPHILLVEDSPTTTALLSRYLSEHYHLVHAADGEEAWKMLKDKSDIELVITDINMISIGIASIDEGPVDTIDQLLSIADRRLYF